MNSNQGQYLYYARQYDQAIGQLRKTLELDPTFYVAHYYGLVYVQKAMYKEAIADTEEALGDFSSQRESASRLGYAYAIAGSRASAAEGARTTEPALVGSACFPRVHCLCSAGLADRDRVFEFLQKAYEDRSIEGVSYIKVSPVWDSLRSDPRFADLLRRMNLQP